MIWTSSLWGLERKTSRSYFVKQKLILESFSCIFLIMSNRIIMYFICTVSFIPRLLWIACQNLWLEQPIWCADRPVPWSWSCIIPPPEFLQVCPTERQYHNAPSLLVSRKHHQYLGLLQKSQSRATLRLFCFATLVLLLSLSFVSTKDEMKLNVLSSVKLT